MRCSKPTTNHPVPFTYDQVEGALEASGLFDDGASIYEDYSGRAMYGATCFGIVAPGPIGSFWAFLAEDVGAEAAANLAANQRTDAMGLDTIHYFPGFELVEEEA